MRKLLGAVATLLVAAAPSFASLSPVVTVSGKVRLSLDAVGTNNAAGADIRVNKPSAAATVRVAYMAAATTGFTGYWIPNGGITIDGLGVAWDPAMSIANSINSYNFWGVVTDIVRPKLNAAPPGITTFHVVESAPYGVDGEILAVIWDDPTAPDTTITLMYGAQQVLGDSFTVTLAHPIDKTNPLTVLDMSLGISYGYQAAGNWSQYSILELGVNGVRISSSAGGQDDGVADNGALITVGGIGDSNANPPDPYANGGANSPRYDDELYNLLPFVANGATSFTVNTHNPSNDDNVYFAAIVLGANTAVVGEGILLSPATGQVSVGGSQSVTATVQSLHGDPVVGRTVEFEVISGPNLGKTGSAVTNLAGVATWTYSSTLAGVDTIEGSFINSSGSEQESNLVTRTWKGANPVTVTITLTPDGVRNPTGSLHTLTARVLNNMGAAVVGPVTFEVVAGPNPRILGTVSTNASGIAQLTYSSPVPGTDAIRASINAGGIQYSNWVQKVWEIISVPTLYLSPGAATNPVNGRHFVTVRAFQPPNTPAPGEPVVVNVIAGPNTGLAMTGITGADGSVTVSYPSYVGGLDYLQAATLLPPSFPAPSNTVTKLWSGLLCDVDNNGKVDIVDIQAITLARNTLVLPGDVRDADFDGLVSLTDVRKCTLACTKLNCAQ